MEENEKSAFRSGFDLKGSHGFRIKFENGITVSVQFGRGNYCSRYANITDDLDESESETAEIAAWKTEDFGRSKWWHFDKGKFKKNETDVLGYCGVDVVMNYLEFFRRYPAE